jgi:hypothetical protein
MSDAQFVKETFWNLLSREEGIVIPIIQRAYTQGGRGKKGQQDESIERKGEAFLQCLVDALVDGKRIELDFIYGTTENGKIQPLDGQQRLTTLFLLHWYIAQKESRLSEVKSTLKKFTYETRSSSRYFCNKLCDFTVPINEEPALHRIIEDQGWFALSWKNDPSVLSMLGMLDKIHKKLSGQEYSLWDKLVSPPDTAFITFFYTPLEAFSLTDELYIKMNARGKELTLFEKFKASIERKIEIEGWDKGKSADQTFGNQMDNEWTDLFWHFRVPVKNQKKETVGYHIDKSLLRFIAAMLISHYAEKDEEKTVRLFNDPESILPEDFDKESYDFIYETLNMFYTARNNFLDNVINNAVFWWGEKSIKLEFFNDFFKLFIASGSDKAMTWQQQAVFYGFSLYLKNNSFDIAKLADWLCFVINVITNGTIDAYEPFVSAKKRLDEFAQMSSNIYLHLAALTEATNGFAFDQMKEEIQKAKIYANLPDAKPFIQEIENCNFCRGHVGFVFECLDVKDSDPDINRLSKMKDILFAYLNENDISNDFRRALLTVDDNCYYTFWENSAHIPDGYIEYGPLMDKPQYCLITDRNKENDRADIRNFSIEASRGRNRNRRYLKKLLTDLLLANILPGNGTLRKIIEDFVPPQDMPGWKQLLIKEDQWLDDKNPRFLIIDGDHAFLRQSKKAWYPDEIK